MPAPDCDAVATGTLVVVVARGVSKSAARPALAGP
jgi:hypothetical protein